MSKSNQPVSNTDGSPNPNPDRSARPRSFWRSVGIRLSAFFRWIHIYLSMIGLASVLFFSVTGLTLNHPEWTFGQVERTERAEGRLDPSWIGKQSADDPMNRVRIIEHFRASHRVRGALTEFRADPSEWSVAFKGPGYSADAFIEPGTGRYQIVQVRQGLVAVLNDLHKGRDTGPIWSWAIDVSAAVLVLISLTGLILIFTLKLKRRSGLVIAILGTLVLVGFMLYGVQ